MISVIVPIYRVAPYLRQCIDSIRNQSYKDLEILLIDDGSPDECGKICEEYKDNDSRIRVFHTENKGLAAARNLGLKEARGDYLGFVDSDDWIESDMYEILLKKLEEAEADISVCGTFQELNSSTKKLRADEAIYTGKEALAKLIEERVSSCVWNKLYRRYLFHGIAFPEGKVYEEIAIMHRIMNAARKVIIIPSWEYHYRVRPDSITRIHNAKNLIDCADAHLDRYYFIKEQVMDLFDEKQEEILGFVANGFSKVWRWWYGCSAEEKREYKNKIKELKVFTKNNIPLFGYSSWPSSMRLSAMFMHSSSNLSFAVLYALNQVFRRLRPDKANVV